MLTLLSVGEDVDKLALICCWWDSKMIQPFWKTLAISLKTKHILTIQPSSCIPGHVSQRTENACPHRSLYINVHSSLICNIQKLDSKCPSVGGWLNKLWYVPTMVYWNSTQLKGMNYWYTGNSCWVGKRYLPYDSIYITFLKWQNCRNGD